MLTLENNKRNRTLVILFGFIYFMCQICRTDLSAVLVELAPALNVSNSTIGIAVTLGYISYAIGMFVNSMIIDRINTKTALAIGMFGCALTHIGIRIFPYLPVIFVLWFANGYIQSLMWPSVMQLTAANLPLEKQEGALSVVCVFQQIGSLVCYLVAPLGLTWGGWRTVMLMTAVACLTMGFIWSFSARMFKSPTGEQKKNNDTPQEVYPVNWAFIVKTNLIPILFLGIVCGMLRDGISTWTPNLLNEAFNIDTKASIALTAALTLAKILSYSVNPFLVKWIPDLKKYSFALYAICCGLCILLILTYRTGLAIPMLILLALLLLINGCLGINYVITIPLAFTRFGRSATVSGVLDSMFYVGSALASWLFAFIAERGGWDATIISWIVISAACLVIVLKQKQFGPPEHLELPKKTKV